MIGKNGCCINCIKKCPSLFLFEQKECKCHVIDPFISCRFCFSDFTWNQTHLWSFSSALHDSRHQFWDIWQNSRSHHAALLWLWASTQPLAPPARRRDGWRVLPSQEAAQELRLPRPLPSAAGHSSSTWPTFTPFLNYGAHLRFLSSSTWVICARARCWCEWASTKMP